MRSSQDPQLRCCQHLNSIQIQQEEVNLSTLNLGG